MRQRRRIGVAMIVTAIALALVAGLLWMKGSNDLEDDQLAEDYRAVIDDDDAEDLEANRTGPLAAAGVAAVLVLAGVIVVSMAPAGEPDENDV